MLVKEAVYNPDVMSIKITIYRIGKGHAKLMNYMMVAAEMGKEVTVLLELKARFDEENNISWVNDLREAGCRILYGFEQYKVPRIFCFGQPADSHDMDGIKMYIASADWMTRNTENRVEVAAPVYQNNLKQEIWDMLQLQLADNVKGRNVDADGEYYMPAVNPGDKLVDAQTEMMKQ